MGTEPTQGMYDYSILGKRYPLPQIDADCETKELILLNATLLFARKGYSTVSMRDIADSIGIKPASLYNHFAGKEELWQAVLDHAEKLYLLYFQHLDKALAQAGSFGEVLGLIFHEPEKLSNTFTCYAFSMVQAEQFRDQGAARLFTNVFLQYSIDFIQGWFDQCVARGWCPAFDTKTMATMIMHSTLVGLEVKVQEYMGRPVAYDPAAMFTKLRAFIISSLFKQS